MVIVIKVGGSLIYSNNDAEKKSYSAKITKLVDSLFKNKIKCVLVLGCGKVAHDICNDYSLVDVNAPFERRWKGFIELDKLTCQNSLNLVENLSKDSLIFVPIHPLSFALKNKKSKISTSISWMNVSLIERMLNLGVVPFIHGGSILDENTLLSGLSSDSLAAHLAVKLKAKSLFLLTDVNGVFDTPQKQNLIKEFSITKTKAILGGGMDEKIRRVKYSVIKGIPVHILNGNNPSNILQIIKKNKQFGTRLVP